jgi:hypothetical protein
LVDELTEANMPKKIDVFPSLHTLSIRGCFLLTNLAIELMTKRFINLISLDMGGLPNVTSEAFSNLHRLTKLTYINLRVSSNRKGLADLIFI